MRMASYVGSAVFLIQERCKGGRAVLGYRTCDRPECLRFSAGIRRAGQEWQPVGLGAPWGHDFSFGRTAFDS